VSLTVTDDRGGTHQWSAPVTVTAPPPPPAITLVAEGWTSSTNHTLRYTWSGAPGTKVDLYRNGAKIVTTDNDGHHVVGTAFKGTATWRMKVCQQSSTTNCSLERSVTLSN
jgi:hypothetical protein